MTHKEIKDGEIAEQYVLNKLSPDERRAFQEHYFACDECFEQAQTTASFIAGVRQASRVGILPGPLTGTAVTGWANWLRPAAAAAAFASLALAIALSWVLFSQLPKMRSDLARERQSHEQLERENQRLAQANDTLASERQQREAERAKLQAQIDQLAQNKAQPSADPTDRPQANTPLVILDTVRGAQNADQQLVLPSGSGSAMFWIEVEAGTRFDSYSVQILTANHRVVETMTGARANSYGAVAVTVPSRLLPSGQYVVKLFGVKGQRQELAGEYDLKVSSQ